MSNLDEYSHSCVQKKKKTKKKDKYPFVLCWLVGCVRVYLNQKDTVLMNLSSICLQHIFNFSSSLPGSSSFAKIKNQTLQKTKKTEATFNFHFFCGFFFFLVFCVENSKNPRVFRQGSSGLWRELPGLKPEEKPHKIVLLEIYHLRRWLQISFALCKKSLNTQCRV